MKKLSFFFTAILCALTAQSILSSEGEGDITYYLQLAGVLTGQLKHGIDESKSFETLLIENLDDHDAAVEAENKTFQDWLKAFAAQAADRDAENNALIDWLKASKARVAASDALSKSTNTLIAAWNAQSKALGAEREALGAERADIISLRALLMALTQDRLPTTGAAQV